MLVFEYLKYLSINNNWRFKYRIYSKYLNDHNGHFGVYNEYLFTIYTINGKMNIQILIMNTKNIWIFI